MDDRMYSGTFQQFKSYSVLPNHVQYLTSVRGLVPSLRDRWFVLSAFAKRLIFKQACVRILQDGAVNLWVFFAEKLALDNQCADSASWYDSYNFALSLITHSSDSNGFR